MSNKGFYIYIQGYKDRTMGYKLLDTQNLDKHHYPLCRLKLTRLDIIIFTNQSRFDKSPNVFNPTNEKMGLVQCPFPP